MVLVPPIPNSPRYSTARAALRRRNVWRQRIRPLLATSRLKSAPARHRPKASKSLPETGGASIRTVRTVHLTVLLVLLVVRATPRLEPAPLRLECRRRRRSWRRCLSVHVRDPWQQQQ